MSNVRLNIILFLLFVVALVVQPGCTLPNWGKTNEDEQTGYNAAEVSLNKTPTEVDAQEGQPAEQINFSALQSGDLVYRTDFETSGDWDEWIKFSVPSDNNDYEIYIEEGHLYFEVNQNQTTVYSIPTFIYFPSDYADMFVEAQVNNVGSTNLNNISVLCRVSGEGWYELGILSGGEWFIWKFDADVGYSLLRSGGLLDFDYNSPHVISGSCQGESLALYVDGEIPRNAEVTDSSFTEGQAGLSVFAREYPGVAVEIDWFSISVP